MAPGSCLTSELSGSMNPWTTALRKRLRQAMICTAMYNSISNSGMVGRTSQIVTTVLWHLPPKLYFCSRRDQHQQVWLCGGKFSSIKTRCFCQALSVSLILSTFCAFGEVFSCTRFTDVFITYTFVPHTVLANFVTKKIWIAKNNMYDLVMYWMKGGRVIVFFNQTQYPHFLWLWNGLSTLPHSGH